VVEQVGEDVEQFVAGLAQAEHEPALRLHRRHAPLGVGEQLQGPGIVALATADRAIETGHGLGVVIEDLRL
jgi:hypothetical protein